MASKVTDLRRLHRSRDLKPENLLLNENGHVFLCDLGFATKQPRSYRKLGTPQYLAPEILSPQLATAGYTNAVDWYAFGCLLVSLCWDHGGMHHPPSVPARGCAPPSPHWQYEMLTGHVAWGGAYSTPEEIFELILANDLVFPRSMSPDAHDLICRLLEPNPARRLCTAEAVRAHPFFQKVNWDIVRRQVRMRAREAAGVVYYTWRLCSPTGIRGALGAPAAAFCGRPPKLHDLRAPRRKHDRLSRRGAACHPRKARAKFSPGAAARRRKGRPSLDFDDCVRPWRRGGFSSCSGGRSCRPRSGCIPPLAPSPGHLGGHAGF